MMNMVVQVIMRLPSCTLQMDSGVTFYIYVNLQTTIALSAACPKELSMSTPEMLLECCAQLAPAQTSHRRVGMS